MPADMKAKHREAQARVDALATALASRLGGLEAAGILLRAALPLIAAELDRESRAAYLEDLIAILETAGPASVEDMTPVGRWTN